MLQCFSKYSPKMFCKIPHTDFTETAALQKFWFAAVMLSEHIPTSNTFGGSGDNFFKEMVVLLFVLFLLV